METVNGGRRKNGEITRDSRESHFQDRTSGNTTRRVNVHNDAFTPRGIDVIRVFNVFIQQRVCFKNNDQYSIV